MFEIDRIPSYVKEAMAQIGIREEQVELSAFVDMTVAQERAEVYLLASGDTLFSVRGETVDSAPKQWKILQAEQYSLCDLSRIAVEEHRSTAGLTARYREDTVLLASFSNFCKDSVLVFVKYLRRLCEGETIEIEPKDRSDSKCCPKCGMRYPDPNRAVCPHCMEKGKLFWRMLSFFSKYKASLVAILLSLIVLTAMSIITPYLSGGFFYDEVIDGAGEFYGQILFVLILMVSTKLLHMLAMMVNNWVTSKIASKMVFDLKKTIFSAIERLSLSFFTGRQTGGLMTQVNDDSNTIYVFFCDFIPHFIINVVKVAVLAVLLFLMQPVLALLALSTVPLYFLVTRWIYGIHKKLHARRFSSSKSLNAFLADVLSGMRVVKAFAREREEIGRFSGKNEQLAENDRKLAVFHSSSSQLSSVILFLSGNIVAWGFGGWMVMQGIGDFSYGMLMTFVAYVNMIYAPLNFFSDMANRTADCTNAMQRLFEIMDAQPDVQESAEAKHPESLSGEVEFRSVSFSYVKGKKVIDNVSFSIPDGGTLGIVGHTGAGKSTLANLLMRLYEVDEGEILIGGYPVRELTFSSLYGHVAIVSQETYLFMGSILDNIRYARPSASYGEVIEASKKAGAHDFIMKLPDAYHTKVGFGYRDLSGGERQRISIARAILKDPKILILDEATAAMDTGTERRIQEAISALSKGKTTIMIAHRLSTLRDADKLIVIEHGRVEECGTHSELLARENGIYQKLDTLQLEALKSAGIVE